MTVKDKIRTLIVDDVGLERRRLHKLLSADSEIKIIGECTNGRDAVIEIQKQNPDLVFLDVEMPPGVDGIEVLSAIDKKMMPLVIFVTGHDEYARRAFDLHAVDYLSKPYSTGRFEDAVSRAKNRLRTESHDQISARTSAFLEERRSTYPELLWVKENECLLPIKTTEIDWIDVDNHLVRFHIGGKFLDRRQSLSNLEKQLDPKQFWRIGRSCIVNAKCIKKIEVLFQDNYQVVLHSGKTLPMSRDYHKRLKDSGLIP